MSSATSTGSVVVIGGGIVGSFIGYFLRREGFGGPVRVVERDSTYRFSSTALSAASIRTERERCVATWWPGVLCACRRTSSA